jgi:hypothetical protein
MAWILCAFQLRDARELGDAQDRAERDRAHSRLTHYLLASFEVTQTQGGWEGEPAAFGTIRLAEKPRPLQTAIHHLEIALQLPDTVRLPGYGAGIALSDLCDGTANLRITVAELQDALDRCRVQLAATGCP